MRIIKTVLPFVAAVLLLCGCPGASEKITEDISSLEMSVANDDAVLAQLEDNGDVAELKREIDYYLYFKELPDAEAFITEAEARGYVRDYCRDISEDDNEFSYILHMTKYDDVVRGHVHDRTAFLVEAAERHNGYYDGWGCGIVTGAE